MIQYKSEMPTDDESDREHGNPRKRPRDEGNAGRRKVACQTCRLRKIKCSLERPVCSLCKSTNSECVYLTDPPKQTLEKLAETLTGRLDTVSQQLADLRSVVEANAAPRLFSEASLSRQPIVSPNLTLTTPPTSNQPVHEPSRDFSHIPPHRTTAE
jgi:Fungal Zn(2)-Cys(6) binuclear cluster domain